MQITDSGDAVACPLCDGSNLRSLDPYNGYAMNQCTGCSFVFVISRRFPVDTYDKAYSELSTYRSMVDTARRTKTGERGRKQLWWFKRRALRLLKKETLGRLLEVGSGPGTFLLVAQTDGWQVQGVEPSEAAQVANELGAPTYHGMLESFAKTEPAPFSAAVSFEVLEHVPDPRSALATLYSLLAPGGRFILSVPNVDDPYCLQQQIEAAMPPIHINFFSRRSLAAALDAVGFENIQFTSIPIPTSSVRNVFGKKGLLVRLPYLMLLRLLGKADGTTLIAMARRPSRESSAR